MDETNDKTESTSLAKTESTPLAKRSIDHQIEINGVMYERMTVREGKRAIVVVDRGWIFAGDITEQNGRIYLDRAVWIVRWESVGFDGVIKDPHNSKQVVIKALDNRVDVPAQSEIFRIPVSDDWGL